MNGTVDFTMRPLHKGYLLIPHTPEAKSWLWDFAEEEVGLTINPRNLPEVVSRLWLSGLAVRYERRGGAPWVAKR
jgi:hypothetical protein